MQYISAWAAGCFLGAFVFFALWLILKYSYRNDGYGAAFPILCVVGLGTALTTYLAPSVFSAGTLIDTSENSSSVLASQISTLSILGISLVTLYAKGGKIEQYQRPRSITLWLALLGYFFFETCLSSLFGSVPSFPWKSTYSLLALTAIFLSPPSSIEKCVTVIKLIALSILYLSAVALLVTPEKVIESSYTGLIPGLSFRFHGILGHANAMAPLIVFYLLFEYVHPFRGLWRVINISLAVGILILTQSKTSWVSALIMFLYIFYYRNTYSTMHKVFLIGFVFLVVLLVWEPLSIFLNTSEAAGSLATFTGRTRIWEITIQEFFRSPFFGYGQNLWDVNYRTNYGMPFAGQAHNQVLQILGAAGLVGFAGFLYYFMKMLQVALKFSPSTRGSSLLILVVLAVYSFSEVPFGFKSVLGIGFFMHAALFAYFVTLVNLSPRSGPNREFLKFSYAVPA